jgi:hypothetical protein
MAATVTGSSFTTQGPQRPRRKPSGVCPAGSTWVDTHFNVPYTTTLMAKTDLASGPRAGRDSGSRRSWIYWTVATVVLLAGFADLARGGVTLAPILLVIGYCVLVPLAILR